MIGTLPTNRERSLSDKLVQSHVLRHLRIIGEACWRISDHTKSARPDVPRRRIAAVRHVIVHDHFRVNWDRVHAAARLAVPELRPAIVELLG